MDCLKSIDMMGKEFRFNVDGMSAFKTSLGGFMTIFKLIAFLVLIWYFGQDIYNRKEPVLLITNSMDDQYPNITLDSTIFNFAYRVEDAYGLTIDDPSYFTYDIIFQELESGSDNIFKELNRDTTELEKCSEKHFKREVLDFYNLQNYRCHENNFTLGGSWGASFIKVPQYFLRLCDSKTEVKYNVKCKTKDEIINFYKNTKNYLFNLVIWHESGERRNFQEDLKLLLEKFSIKSVIDFGCGVGSDSLFLLENNIETFMIDFNCPSTDFLKWRMAKRNLLEGKFLDADNIDVLPASEMFWAIDVLEHIPDPEEVIEKLSDETKIFVHHSPFNNQAGGRHPCHIYFEEQKLNDALQNKGFRNIPWRNMSVWVKEYLL